MDEQRPTAALTESTKLLCLAQATNLTGLALYFCRKEFSRLILICLGKFVETSVYIGFCLSKTLVAFPLLEGVPRCAEPLTYFTDLSCSQGLPLASVYPSTGVSFDSLYTATVPTRASFGQSRLFVRLGVAGVFGQGFSDRRISVYLG